MSGNAPQLKQQQAIRRWSTAEQRLYPALVSSPVGYDRYVAVVRGVCDELGSVRDVEALVDAYDEGLDIAERAARSRSLPIEGLNLEVAVGAAFCLRYREVLAETRLRDIQGRVDEAKARGDSWVVLEGTSPWLEMPFPPWRSVEMHLPEGAGIHAWAEESLDTKGDGIDYGVEVLKLNPATGQWQENEPPTDRRIFSDYQIWQDEIAKLKARYDGLKPFDTAREMGG